MCTVWKGEAYKHLSGSTLAVNCSDITIGVLNLVSYRQTHLLIIASCSYELKSMAGRSISGNFYVRSRERQRKREGHREGMRKQSQNHVRELVPKLVTNSEEFIRDDAKVLLQLRRRTFICFGTSSFALVLSSPHITLTVYQHSNYFPPLNCPVNDGHFSCAWCLLNYIP